MLDIVAIVVCPGAFAAVLAATFVLGRTPSGTALAAVLAGTGTLAVLLPLLLVLLPVLSPARLTGSEARSLSPLASCVATAQGVASLAGAWIAARILPHG